MISRISGAIFVAFSVFLLLVSSSTRSYAVMGVGDLVFDPQAFAQSLTNYSNQIRQYVQQCQQYAMQLKQYSAQMQNLQNFGYMIDLSGFGEMQKIMSSAKGIASDYQKLQSEFDQIYPEFSKFSNMSGKDFAAKAREWLQQTSDTNRDALNMISKTKDWFNSDSNDLSKLTMKANSVVGAKDGLQAIAQISALQSKQLLQLQQTMSASARAEGAYMAQRAAEEAAAREELKRLIGDVDNDLKKIRNSEKPTKPWWDR